MRPTNVEHMSVPRPSIEKVLELARTGESPVVEYQNSSAAMANAAVKLSRKQCAEIVELCLELLVQDRES